MISPVKLTPVKNICKKFKKEPRVQFFCKDSSFIDDFKKGKTTNSITLIGASLVASTMLLYSKYRRKKIAKGEKLNPKIDKIALNLNKKMNKIVYNVSKTVESKGFKKFAKVIKSLIFKI